MSALREGVRRRCTESTSPRNSAAVHGTIGTFQPAEHSLASLGLTDIREEHSHSGHLSQLSRLAASTLYSAPFACVSPYQSSVVLKTLRPDTYVWHAPQLLGWALAAYCGRNELFGMC